MRYCLKLIRGKEIVDIKPFGSKYIIKMYLDSPETLEVITKLRKKGFEEEKSG